MSADSKPPWDPKSWEVWVRWVAEGARCPYCGLDGRLLSNWRQMDTEHIIPSGSWEPLNLTVACHGCNRAKSNWNPVTGQLGYNPNTDKQAAPTNEEERQTLMAAAREYVKRQWESGSYTSEIHERQLNEGDAMHKTHDR